MSKPWFHIQSVTYSSSVVTFKFDFGRLRGDVFGNKTITIDGFSNSISFTENKFYETGEIATFSVGALGTSSTATYTDPSSITWTFAGAPGTSSNARLTLGSTQLSSFTSSVTNLASFISGIATSIIGNSRGVSAATTSTTLIVSVPNTGNLYNSTQLSLNLTSGNGSVVATSSSGLSNSGTFSGGVTTYNLYVSTPAGGYGDVISVRSNTASVLI